MVLVATFVAALVTAPPPGSMETHRYAVVVGSEKGTIGEPTLHYALQDAQGVAQVLTELGGFGTSDVFVLDNPTSADVVSTFEHVQRLVRQDASHGDNTLMVVYFSGHADATGLHLGGTILPYRDLMKFSDAVQATSRVLVIDACRSGEATLQKGVRRIAPLFMPQDEQNMPAGLAVLASASAGESAQESPRLQGSFFTHYLISALRGAADFNADGKVTLTEAFQYSADQTAASTADTLAGIQHATYRYAMRGHADLVLTKPSQQADIRLVSLVEPGDYVFHLKAADGPVVLETRVTERLQSAWLPSGHYYVQRRTLDTLWGGPMNVSSAKAMILTADALERLDYIPLASKGSDAPPPQAPASNAISLWGGTSTPQLPGFAMPFVGALQITHNFERIAFDTQLTFINDTAHQTRANIQMYQINLLFGARYLFINGDTLRLSAGLRAGPGFARQTFGAPSTMAPKTQLSVLGQAVVRADVMLPRNFFLGIEGGVDAGGPYRSDQAVRFTPHVVFGVGYNF